MTELNEHFDMHHGEMSSKCDQVKNRSILDSMWQSKSNGTEVQAHGGGRGLRRESVVTQQTMHCSRSQDSILVRRKC